MAKVTQRHGAATLIKQFLKTAIPKAKLPPTHSAWIARPSIKALILLLNLLSRQKRLWGIVNGAAE
jgi:hypothetical protein